MADLIKTISIAKINKFNSEDILSFKNIQIFSKKNY